MEPVIDVPAALDQFSVPADSDSDLTTPLAEPTKTCFWAITGLFPTAAPTSACQRGEADPAATRRAVTLPLSSATTSVDAPGSNAGEPTTAPGTVAVQERFPVASLIA